jgi:hypothetical protein
MTGYLRVSTLYLITLEMAFNICRTTTGSVEHRNRPTVTRQLYGRLLIVAMGGPISARV